MLDSGVEFSGRDGTTRWRKITFLVDAYDDEDDDHVGGVDNKGDGEGSVHVVAAGDGEVGDGEVDGSGEGNVKEVLRGPRVKLNPEEHVDYVWAGEEEVKAGLCDGREVVFAYDGAREVILEGLRMAREGVL